MDQRNRPYFGDELVFLETYDVHKIKEPTSSADKQEGGIMKRMVLLFTALSLIVTMIAASTLSVSAQDYSGQYASDDQYNASAGQYAPITGQAADTGQAAPICAPWSQDWNISKGEWWYVWYRWCYDPTTSDPSIEANWYRERGDWGWGEPANLCPESGKCTVSTGPGSVQMSTDSTTPVTDTQTYTDTPADSTTPATDTQATPSTV